MSIGFRAFLEFERPDPELIQAFRGIPSSNIGDCVKKMNCMFGGIRAFNHLPLVGTAFTVKVPSGDNLVAQTALDYTRPGDILVIDGAGYTDRALVGDEDGLVVIPRTDAPALLEAARQNLAGEQETLARMEQGGYTLEEHKKAFTGLFERQGGRFM